MWHGLGTVLEDYPGREEAIVAAGHDFQIDEQPVFLEGSPLPIEGYKSLQRSDTGKTFHIVRDSYQVMQNEVLWDLTDAIVEQPNVRYETAGVLKDGAVLWVLAWLDEPAEVPGDSSPIYPFVMVSSAHDGSASLRATASSIRVVCWNTYSAAIGAGTRADRDVVIRHTKNWKSRVEDAKQIVKGTREGHAQFLELAHELSAIEVSDAGTDFFLREFIPEPAAAVASDRVMANIEEARDAVKAILRGPSQETITGSAWGLFQAGIEYLDHARNARSVETRFNRTLLRPERMKDSLVPMARRAAEVG
jgi:phage/plasmid-like protein (TIGR03299 family)